VGYCRRRSSEWTRRAAWPGAGDEHRECWHRQGLPAVPPDLVWHMTSRLPTRLRAVYTCRSAPGGSGGRALGRSADEAGRVTHLPHDAVDGAVRAAFRGRPGWRSCVIEGAEVPALGHAAARASLPGSVGASPTTRSAPPGLPAGRVSRCAGAAARAGVGGDGGCPPRGACSSRPPRLAAGRSAGEGGQMTMAASQELRVPFSITG